jgi:hypothetical protein
MKGQFSPKEKEIIAENMDKLTVPRIAKILHRKERSIYLYFANHGIKKPSVKGKGRKPYKKKNNPWANPSIAMAKTNLALRSKNLKPSDIPDQLAEIHALHLKFKHQTNG